MYLDHYGLTEPPFRITPHTEFFYEGANRGATLEALLYAILHGEGLVKVTGEVGAGKTMLCRVLMERLPAQVDIVYLANPSLSREDILLAIAADLKIDLPTDRPNVLIRTLQEALIARYAEGRQVVVLIDEAHAMPEESLEEVRLLSNLEHGHNKLMQIVLFGQPELNDKLAAQNMRQLRERITHGFELAPLHQQDIGEYLMFRLRTAGYKGPDIFTPKAVRLIADESEGLTRRINILADKALIASFANQRHQVDVAEARAAIADSAFRRRHPSRWRLPAIGSALLASGIAAGIGAAQLWATDVAKKPSPLRHVAPVQQPVAPPQVKPVVAPAATHIDPPSPSPTRNESLLERRLRVTEPHFKQSAPTLFTILLMDRPKQQTGDLEGLLDLASQQFSIDDLYVYPTVNPQGVTHYGLTLGLYESRKAAMTELNRLPAKLKRGHPLLRTVGGILSEPRPS
jgi:type II secretory pathway predicted ATPase ExeA